MRSDPRPNRGRRAIRAIVRPLFFLLALLPAGCRTQAPAAAPAAALAVDHLYLDLDGTLLDSEGRIPPANLAAIRRFQAAGGRVGVATGRMPERGLALARAISADLPLIFANGAVITDPAGRLLRMRPIGDAGAISRMCALILAGDCRQVYTALGDPAAGRVQVEDGVCRPAAGPSSGVIKIRGRCCTAHAELLRKLPAEAAGCCTIIESGSGEYLGVSISAAGVDKGQAIAWVAARLGFDPARTAFVGDSGNDVAAAREVERLGGLCFAMGNATAALAAACPRHLTRDCDHGGVAEAIERLLSGDHSSGR